MLVLAENLWERMVAHCLACLPMEGCGLIAGYEAPVEPVVVDDAVEPAGTVRAAAAAAAATGSTAQPGSTVPTAQPGSTGSTAQPGSTVSTASSGSTVSTASSGSTVPTASSGSTVSTLARALEVYPATNAAASARLYTVEPRDLLRADRAAEAAGMQLIGVWHSHTHTPAYPSPTDVRQAPDPSWHYVLVSLSEDEPVVRSYRIREGKVEEEQVTGP